MNGSLEIVVATVVAALSLLTALFLWASDSRVYDLNGKLIPGCRSNLWGKNFPSLIREARNNEAISKCITEVILPELGDGSIAAWNR